MNHSAIIVHEVFERTWSWVADYWHRRWQEQGADVFFRRVKGEVAISDFASDLQDVQRLVVLGPELTPADLQHVSQLKELVCVKGAWAHQYEDLADYCSTNGIDDGFEGGECGWASRKG